MKRLRNQSGMTLLEISIGLAISALLLVPLASIVTTQLRIPLKLRSELGASHQIQKATLILTQDAAVAQSFVAGTEPDYGTFKWFEFIDPAPVEQSARYFWENQQVLRVVDRPIDPLVPNPGPPQVVLAPVLQYSDVTFQHTPSNWTYNSLAKTWTYTEGKITVSLKTTHETVAEFPETIFTAQLVADMRPQKDQSVPLPGRLGAPTPLPNQVAFKGAGNPTLLQGKYQKGSGADLAFDDTNYYQVRWAGIPRTVIWEATSEIINYTNISDITVEFIGRVDSEGVVQQIFIFNPLEHIAAGYSDAPDHAITYTNVNADKRVSVTLDETDIAYVNSLPSKVIKVKIAATHTAPFDLSGDKLIFKVAGTPAPGFSRDYRVQEDPAVEVGLYESGNFVSLAQDDTDYYMVREVGQVVQWSVVSEHIALDPISSIEVIFTARVTRGKPIQQIFVFNPANGGDGYSSVPDSEMTYPKVDTDFTVSFPLKDADLAYVKSLSPREVLIRVKGTDPSANWRLQADQLVFRAKP